MLFANVLGDQGVIERIRRLRKKPIGAYGLAVLSVALTILLRLAVGSIVSASVTFTTFFVAIIIAAFVGGFWPGMVAVILSAVSGWYLFLPPAFSFALEQPEAFALLLFVIVATVAVAVVSGLVGSILIHEERQKFLFRELQHRSQNLFAVIQAIASRSLVEGQPLSQIKEILNGRLMALAHTHSMLANNAWVGAPLNEIIARELSGFEGQVSVKGCDIVVDTPAAQNFALIVHELRTNAVKHGALSSPGGHVTIDGLVLGDNGQGQFRFTWSESGGPRVIEPTRQGFGSAVLLEMAKRFGQAATAVYRPEGLTYEFQALLSAIQPSSQSIQDT
jgi:two-component sensor histidine kinase